MRRGAIAILVVSFVMIFLSPSAFSQGAKSSGQAAAPIKIGGAISLTGPWAETGKWVKEGYDL
jgi:ABC-type branched-subunit amino acid transport system substrate-binding protein